MRAARGSLAVVGLVATACYSGLEGGRGDGDAQGAESAGTGGDTDGAGDGPAAAQLPAQPMHRLGRLEFNNTVRDLLGTDLRPADAFGPDPEANGFDNMAEQLGVSSVLLDGYAAAARDAIADAIDERPVFRVRLASTELGIPAGYGIGELWALSGGAIDVAIDVPIAADAEVVFTGGTSVVGSAPAPQATLEIDGVAVSTFAVAGSGAIPVEHVHPINLAPGPHTIRLTPTNYVNSPELNVSNNIFASSLMVRSIATTMGPGHDMIYVCEPVAPTADACYEAILRNFAFRAWRRPLRPEEAEGLVALFDTVRTGGETDDDALRMVMRAVMLSPKFAFRTRATDDADADGWLDPYVLASRLSYFLWSSMPDDRLFAAAADGSLATDEGLSDAVAWMLADPKSQALQDGFAEQWLSTRYLPEDGTATTPDFDAALSAAMLQESKLFFGDFLINDLPASAMIRPDFAYLNDRLAQHYGVGAPGSAELVRVPVADGGRGGLLMLGAWLTTHAEGEHSSPIRRGRWVSDVLLCTPVPPPPPGLVIEPIEPSDSTSVREALEQHRNDPSCAACHAMLDVLGIGFEELDGLARLRTDPEIDNLGELPDGREFEGAAELSGLFAESEVFVGCLTEKLFTYAVGRAPATYDAEYLDAIGRAAIARGDDLPAVIDAIVHTPAFRSPASLAPGE